MTYLGNQPADVALVIGDGAVDTAQLAADAVENAKIADGQVDTEHLAADAVEAAGLASNSVVNASVTSDAAIAYSKLGTIPTFNQNTTGSAATATLASTVTVADSTANTNFPVVFHSESNALYDDTGALRYNPSTGELLVPKLTVAGTTTTVDTVTMNAANAVVFEGATANDYETTLTITDPTADRTITLPNATGTVAFTSSNITGSAATLTTPRTIGGTSFDGSANIAITTNANLTGEVTSSGNATTIADDIIQEGNLQVSNGPTNGYMLTAQSGVTGGLTWAAAGSFTADQAQTFNDSGAAVDFRIEGDTDQNLFFLDGSADRVGIGVATPDFLLQVRRDSADTYLLDCTNDNTTDGSAVIIRTSTASSSSRCLDVRPNGVFGGFMVLSNGNVGVGTGAPDASLHVNSASGMARVVIDSDSSEHTELQLHTEGTLKWNIRSRVNVGDQFEIRDEDENDGVIMGQGQTSFSSGSDERLKCNWIAFDDALSDINSLTKVGTFQYKYFGEDEPRNDVIHSGLSGQEVQKFLPSCISEDNEGYLSMRYQEMIPVLVKSIQELSAKVEALESA